MNRRSFLAAAAAVVAFRKLPVEQAGTPFGVFNIPKEGARLINLPRGHQKAVRFPPKWHISQEVLDDDLYSGLRP